MKKKLLDVFALAVLFGFILPLFVLGLGNATMATLAHFNLLNVIF